MANYYHLTPLSPVVADGEDIVCQNIRGEYVDIETGEAYGPVNDMSNTLFANGEVFRVERGPR